MTMIALSGEIGAGKDTFGDILVDIFGQAGYDAEIVKFAEPLKQVIAHLSIPDSRELKEVVQRYDLERENVRWAVQSVFQYMPVPDCDRLSDMMWSKLVACDLNFSPRQFQQWLGMGARDIRSDYFIHHLQQYCSAGPGKVFVVTDGRFVNEREVADTGIHITRADNPLRVSTTDTSEAAQGKLCDLAEFLVYNEEREDWRELLEEQAQVIVNLMEHRGYVDDVEFTGGTGE